MRWFLIDKVLEIEKGRFCRALKNVTLDQDYMQSHFPSFPVMPNSLIIESIAQTGGILVGHINQFKYKVILAKVEKAKFLKMVRPGDQLIIEAEIVEGKWDVRETEDVPFSQLAEEYLEYIKSNKAKGTYTANKYRVGTHLLPYFGDTPLSQITPQMVDNYKTMRLRDGIAPSTVNEELARLSHMMTMAIRWRYIDKNIVSKVERLKVPERLPRFLIRE